MLLAAAVKIIIIIIVSVVVHIIFISFLSSILENLRLGGGLGTWERTNEMDDNLFFRFYSR